MPEISDELLPCPFCGGAAELVGPDPRTHIYVRCPTCGARGCVVVAGHGGTTEEAIAAWNRRAEVKAARAGKGVGQWPGQNYELYEIVHNAAIAAYEAHVPADYRYSASALRHAVDAAISAALPSLEPQGAQEAVAWRWRHSGGPWRFLDNGEMPDDRDAEITSQPGYEVEPLYASPTGNSVHGGVRVKPLEWRAIGPVGSDVEAETELGTYIMSFDAPTAGGATNLWMAGSDVDTFEVYGMRRDAKAAAQADYEQRILSALEPSPVHGGVSEEAVEMARHWIDRYAAGIDEEPQMRRIVAALTAASVQQGKAGWRDIVSDPPPKDGTFVLLYNVAHGAQAVMGWTADVGMPDIFPDGCWTDAGSRNQAINLTVNGGYFQYWQPLPTPPSIPGDGR